MWRRIVPKGPGWLLVGVRGNSASTLVVFDGRRPGGDNALDCVNRAGSGALRMRVLGRAGRPLWVRIGADKPSPGAEATLTVADGTDAVVVDGGPGGFDPTTGGPGGGLPNACSSARTASASIAGPRLAGKPKTLNRRHKLPVKLTVHQGPVCDVTAQLVGPRGRVYAVGRKAALLTGKRVLAMRRTRSLVKGSYHVTVTAVSELGGRVTVRTRVSGRLK
jgi:hypothetical protein